MSSASATQSKGKIRKIRKNAKMPKRATKKSDSMQTTGATAIGAQIANLSEKTAIPARAAIEKSAAPRKTALNADSITVSIFKNWSKARKIHSRQEIIVREEVNRI